MPSAICQRRILRGFGGGGGGNGNGQPFGEPGQFPEEFNEIGAAIAGLAVGVMIALICVAILVGIVLWAISTIARGGLIAGVTVLTILQAREYASSFHQKRSK